MSSHYLKFQIPYGVIRDYLVSGNYKNIIFHVDLPSISRGFYNKQVIEMELSSYITERKLPELFFRESKEFLNKLYSQFKSYNPKFSIFYDDGQCLQNKGIYNGYKDRSSAYEHLILEDNALQLYQEIKTYYYNVFPERFNIPKVSHVTFLKQYEADFIPWIMLVNNIWDCQNYNTLNIILSVDKDLLQCCQFANVIQIFTLYSKKTRKIEFNVYNDETAMGQIYSKFQRGILTSKYIPLLLSLAGDKADKIPGIPQIGEARAYKLVIDHNLPYKIHDQTQFPPDLEEFRNIILRNYKLISFEEQLKRIPPTLLESLINQFKI